MKTLKKQLDELKQLKFNSYNKDFLLTWEKSEQELRGEIARFLEKTRPLERVMNEALAADYAAMDDQPIVMRNVANAFQAAADATKHVCDLSDGEEAKAQVLAALEEPA